MGIKRNKIKVYRLLLILFLLTLNLTTWAVPSNSNQEYHLDAFGPTSTITVLGKLDSCEFCYGNVSEVIHSIHSRTYESGSSCEFCTNESIHLTEVHTQRRVASCLKTCTYETLENLPTQRICKRIP